MTVCAKSLTLPGDAVPCPLGPEDTREPSMTSKPESKASEQLQWDSFALWPAIRYVFKPMDKNYNQHRLKPPVDEMQLSLALYAGHAPEKLRVKWKCECHILLTSMIFTETCSLWENICLQDTPFTHIMNDGCMFYLWGLKWDLKSSSMEGSMTSLCSSRADWWSILCIPWVYLGQSRTQPTLAMSGIAKLPWEVGPSCAPTAVINTSLDSDYQFSIGSKYSKNIQLFSSWQLHEFYFHKIII